MLLTKFDELKKLFYDRLSQDIKIKTSICSIRKFKKFKISFFFLTENENNFIELAFLLN